VQQRVHGVEDVDVSIDQVTSISGHAVCVHQRKILLLENLIHSVTSLNKSVYLLLLLQAKNECVRCGSDEDFDRCKSQYGQLDRRSRKLRSLVKFLRSSGLRGSRVASVYRGNLADLADEGFESDKLADQNRHAAG